MLGGDTGHGGPKEVKGAAEGNKFMGEQGEKYSSPPPL